MIFYIDAAVTGQFVDLPITSVKISLGIFTQKAREKEHMWKTLGYLPSYSAGESIGKRIMLKSEHMDSKIYENRTQLQSEEGNVGDQHHDAVKAQDLHSMLAIVLESYIELQKEGFIWDLVYKNKVYSNIHFVLFTPFLKLDTEEAEKLCGSYTVRNNKVSQLCRYCECPTEECDNPYAKYPMKKAHKIQALIDADNTAKLKELSQQKIENACYKLRFGMHNKQGVHGSCPMEMLHQLYLGIFKYVCDAFFGQIGKESGLKDTIDAFCQQYGDLLSCQSEHNLPSTSFSCGVLAGKMMARQYSGVILCLAAVVHSSRGRALITKHRAKLRKIGKIDDWQMLLELLLQWEMWLKCSQMRKKHVKRARTKHRYLMYLIKRIAKREEGMGYKMPKFHGIMHIAQDILDFGIPMEVDTAANESGHKSEKKAAKLMQNLKSNFDEQTGKRIMEMSLLELADQEISGNCLWEYAALRLQRDPEEEVMCKPSLGGWKYHLKWCNDNQKYVAFMNQKVEVRLENDIINFILDLQNKLVNYTKLIYIYPLHKRNGVIFRANTQFKGNVW